MLVPHFHYLYAIHVRAVLALCIALAALHACSFCNFVFSELQKNFCDTSILYHIGQIYYTLYMYKPAAHPTDIYESKCG